jgi:hypothetical protein
MNPAVLDAFALAICGAGAPPAYPGVPGHEPDVEKARRDAAAVTAAMGELLKLTSPAPLMSGRPTTSSRAGRTRSGATVTRGCERSSRNTIQRVSSFSITVSAARAGAPTGSPALSDK